MPSIEEYDVIDFPELIHPPAISYVTSRLLEGVEKEHLIDELFGMDHLIQCIVDELGSYPVSPLAFKTPEQRTQEDVLIGLGMDNIGDIEARTLACIRKATLILQGKMLPNPVWERLDAEVA